MPRKPLDGREHGGRLVVSGMLPLLVFNKGMPLWRGLIRSHSFYRPNETLNPYII